MTLGAALYFWWQLLAGLALHKIGNHVAQAKFNSGFGEVEMREPVHAF